MHKLDCHDLPTPKSILFDCSVGRERRPRAFRVQLLEARVKVGHRGPALLSMRAGAANTCAGAVRPIRVGFRSNGTMAGKIRWSMFVQGSTFLSSGTYAEMRAASGKLPLFPAGLWQERGRTHRMRCSWWQCRLPSMWNMAVSQCPWKGTPSTLGPRTQAAVLLLFRRNQRLKKTETPKETTKSPRPEPDHLPEEPAFVTFLRG